MPDLAALAALLADRTRVTICVALLDGAAWAASDLARFAGVAPSTATEHLNLLVAGGLLAEERRGRRRCVRLAGPDTAEILENLAGLAPYRAVPVRSLAEANHRRALGHARTCYDHIAGALGVAIVDAMTERSLLDREFGTSLTHEGGAWLAGLGVLDVAPTPEAPEAPADAPTPPAPAHRAYVRTCLDWTVRRRHLAGAVGAALCRHALDRRWLLKSPGSRLLTVTDEGRAAFEHHLGLPREVLRNPVRRRG